MNVRFRDGSGRRQYKFLVEDTDRHGNVRVYFRRKGCPKIRFSSLPGSPEFDAQYQLAFRGELKPATGAKRAPAGEASFRYLCERYFKSAVFDGLDGQTRKTRKRILEPLIDRIGELPYRAMETKDIAKLRDEKRDTPAAANQIVSIFRQLYAWACDEEVGLATYNPAAKARKLEKKNPDGFKAWDEANVDRYLARWPTGTTERLAMDLLLYTGSRRSDAIRFGRQMVQWIEEADEDGNPVKKPYLVWTEFKGRKKIAKVHRLPILPQLWASIDATKTGDLVFLVKEDGKPFEGQDFTEWFRQRCKLAKVDVGMSAHGVRKYSAIRCAEEGATEQQLMALYGWTDSAQAVLYTRKANRNRMAAQIVPMLGRS